MSAVTPKADKMLRCLECPLSARSGHSDELELFIGSTFHFADVGERAKLSLRYINATTGQLRY
jgi:hypothetical protein